MEVEKLKPCTVSVLRLSSRKLLKLFCKGRSSGFALLLSAFPIFTSVALFTPIKKTVLLRATAISIVLLLPVATMVLPIMLLPMNMVMQKFA